MTDKTEPQDLEGNKAEEHVQEIMGPADYRMANMPMPPETETALEVAQSETPAVEPVAEPPVASEPDEPDALPEESNEEPKPLPQTEDKATDTAVDDIMHNDADAALPEQPDEDAVVMKSSFRERLKNMWLSWWSNPWKRYGTIAVLVILLAVIAFVAPVRAMVLNTVGVRSSIMVHVYDGATNLPLENAVVQVDSKSAKTDANGQVKITGIHLGKRTVTISKLAFAATTKQVALGVRIIDLGEVTLKPVGTQLTFVFTDYLSGKPITDVTLTSGESTARSDKKGKAIITLQPGSTKDSKITASKDTYRTDELSTPSDITATTNHKLVPATPAVFVSKESGKHDVYKMYLDGKNRSVLLAGTGLETQAIATLPSPSGEMVAVVSTRDERRDNGGYLLTALNVIDVATGSRTNIEYAEQITLLGWDGNTLVYQQTVAGTSAANSSRQKIIAYDTNSSKRFQLANANYFAGTQLIGSTLYYTVSATDPGSSSSFARVKTDSSSKSVIYTGTVWSLLRTGYDTMKLQTKDKWYEYTVSTAKLASSTPSTDYASRFYVDNPEGKTSVWVDVRDINGVLIARNLSTAKEKELTTQKSMQAPLYWLNNSTVVYRVSGSDEVADYAINVDGGKAHKIADVSLTNIR
jgi:hypothetical protein